MLNHAVYNNYLRILEKELIPALGCTEPIAIALAAAKARDVLGEFPDSLQLCCSGNIIKNVKGVTVPNSNGLKGINVAATLGVVAGNAGGELEVLGNVTDAQREQTVQLIQAGFFSCTVKADVDNLYIVATVRKGDHYAEVTIVNRHTLIAKVVKDGEVLFEQPVLAEKDTTCDKSQLNIQDIIAFANQVKPEDVAVVLDRQIAMNTEISKVGLQTPYGAQVGMTLLGSYGDDVRTRAKARAAAGSDARMGGCALPVVINSGSGNQGLTVTLPVIEYAETLGVTREQLYRALVISNLTAMHLKTYIGNLSAFCGAVSAACGAGAAITYLCGGSYEQISGTIVNTLADVGGIVCDGAKPSCAAKIASAVDAAILAHTMSMQGLVFSNGDGIVQQDVEKTIQSMGYVGRIGMKTTDLEILNIMTDKVTFA